MPGLNFAVDSAEAVPFAAAPSIAFQLRVTNPNESEAVHSVALRCQLLIEAARRQYTTKERDELSDLFGEADRWSRTLRPLLWTHVSTTVPAFSGAVLTELVVPCTFDFNVAAAKYFHAVAEDDIPLCFQFSGTIFYADTRGALQIDQIGWDKETRFRLAAGVWRDMMDHYYPDSAWLRLRRDAFERLYAWKREHGLATWEEAINQLVAAKSAPAEKERVC